MELYLELDKSTLDATSDDANKRAMEQDDEKESKNKLLYGDLELDVDTSETPTYSEKENVLEVYGRMKTSDGKDLGFMSLSIDLDFDLVLQESPADFEDRNYFH